MIRMWSGVVIYHKCSRNGSVVKACIVVDGRAIIVCYIVIFPFVVILMLPLQTQILVSHVVRVHSSSVETLCFFLTLLSATVTPVFCLSERWIHLPCGCFINCGQDVGSVSSASEYFNNHHVDTVLFAVWTE